MGQLGLRLINIALFSLCCFLTAGVVNQIVADRLAPDYGSLTPQELIQNSTRPGASTSITASSRRSVTTHPGYSYTPITSFSAPRTA